MAQIALSGVIGALSYALDVAEGQPLAANHHEKLNGSGYPRGLAAGDLDLPMRVLAIADVYEALTADRPYRPPLAPEEARSHSSLPARLHERPNLAGTYD